MSADRKALAVINEYAPKIIEAHAAVQSNAKTMMEHAIVAGELLSKAKKKVGHGEWAEWVQENCKFSARTASDYMRMAEHKKEIGRASADSICGALKTLAKPKQTTEKESAPKTAGPPESDSGVDEQKELTLEERADAIVLEIMAELDEVDDDDNADLLGDLILQKLAFALKKVTPSAEKKRGRPAGSKNKPKDPPTPGEKHATAVQEQADEVAAKLPKSWDLPGNDVDNDRSAEARKAMFDDSPEPAPPPASSAEPTSPVVPDDGSIPDWLKRDQQDGRAA
jgi:hypothetical protein